MDILAVIARLPYRAARPTYYGKPQVPHEYTVRAPETEEDYVALYNTIQSLGVFERFGKSRRHYLYPGDGRKYWAMTNDITQSRILNRMKIEDDLERLRETGQIKEAALSEKSLVNNEPLTAQKEDLF